MYLSHKYILLSIAEFINNDAIYKYYFVKLHYFYMNAYKRTNCVPAYQNHSCPRLKHSYLFHLLPQAQAHAGASSPDVYTHL